MDAEILPRDRQNVHRLPTRAEPSRRRARVIRRVAVSLTKAVFDDLSNRDRRSSEWLRDAITCDLEIVIAETFASVRAVLTEDDSPSAPEPKSMEAA